MLCKFVILMTKHHFNILYLIATNVVFFLFFSHKPYYWVLVIASISIFLIVLSLGILFLKVQYFLPSINSLKNRKVLLTFDDGPEESQTELILEILDKYKITALFFVIGKKVSENPNILRKIHQTGHEIGNHTYEHSNFFSLLGQRTVISEIEKADAVIEQTIGYKPRFFRPPIGYTNPRIARAVRITNKKIVGWSVRSYDSVLHNPTKLLNRLIAKTRSTDIILLHDNLPQTAEMLNDFIATSLKNGIIFASKSDIESITK